MNLHGRSILLTGAGSGIGRSLAVQLAGASARLTLVGRHADGRLTVIRGGETRSQMIARNRDDPAAIDQMLAENKDELEKAVAHHSSL